MQRSESWSLSTYEMSLNPHRCLLFHQLANDALLKRNNPIITSHHVISCIHFWFASYQMSWLPYFKPLTVDVSHWDFNDLLKGQECLELLVPATTSNFLSCENHANPIAAKFNRTRDCRWSWSLIVIQLMVVSWKCDALCNKKSWNM